jgi:hypothetical protein
MCHYDLSYQVKVAVTVRLLLLKSAYETLQKHLLLHQYLLHKQLRSAGICKLNPNPTLQIKVMVTVKQPAILVQLYAPLIIMFSPFLYVYTYLSYGVLQISR